MKKQETSHPFLILQYAYINGCHVLVVSFLIIRYVTDNPMFYTNNLAMHTVQRYSNAIRNVLYGLCVSTGDIHSLKCIDYLPVQPHILYNNLRFVYTCTLMVLHVSIISWINNIRFL